jgi:hypothetical protein
VKFIPIKKQVGEKRGTVCIHRYNKYVVNPKLEHFDGIRFREYFGGISVFFIITK